jgi:hypothetical protein
MKSWLEETMACPGKRETIPEEIEVIAENQEVPNEETAVEMVGALRDLSEDLHLAVKCLRWLIRHAVPSPRKGLGYKGPGKTLSNGNTGQSRRQELCLGSKETFHEGGSWTNLQTGEVTRQAVELYIRI